MKNVVIIGSTSGVGKAAADAFAQRDYRIFGGSRSRAADDNSAWHPIDVTDDESVADFAAAAFDKLGAVHVLVVSAGSYSCGAVEETSFKEIQQQFDTYFYGAVRVLKAFLPALRAQHSGRVIIMNSSAADAAIPFHGAYSASKAAIASMSEALAHEVKPFRIGVTNIMTTGLRTAAVQRLSQAAASIEDYGAARERAVRIFIDSQSTGRDPKVAARAIVKVAEMKNPPVTYRIGVFPRMIPSMKALMPGNRFFDAVAKSFR